MEPVTLRTPRLSLSVPEESDIDAIFAACQDADIQRYTTVPSPYPRERAAEFIATATASWAEGSETTWAMRRGDELVGMMGLHAIRGGNASLGYWTIPAARGTGLTTEAARVVVDWAFAPDGLALTRLEWRAVVGNIGSAKIARALGFHLEGTLRQEFVNATGRSDGWVGGLLASDDRMPQTWPPLED